MRLLERLTIDSEASDGGQHARRTGRSWWALRYTDGRIVHEWDLDAGSPNGHADWPRLATLGYLKHTQALRLYCPNGRMAELGGDGDQSGRLFQFKVAVRYTGAADERDVLAHVIGLVTGYDGQCQLYAWEPLPEPVAPQPGDFLSLPPGSLSESYAAWRKQQRVWHQVGGGRLRGPLVDNVYQLAYHQVGRLSADALGLADGEGR